MRIISFILLLTYFLMISVSADVLATDSFHVVATQNATSINANAQNITNSSDPAMEMVSFVKEAVSYARTNEKEKVLAEFSNRNGSFFRENLYIYAYDFDGITLAHPLQTELIGKSRLYEKDAGDEYFIKNLRDAAINNTGFVVFHYLNPAHNNSVEKKLGYVEKVDDNWWLGSGIYGENVTLPQGII